MDFRLEVEALQELVLRLTRRDEFAFCEGCIIRMPVSRQAELCETCQAEVDALMAAEKEQGLV